MRWKAALACVAFLLAAATDAQDPELPAELQLGLLTKVLSFDRSGALGSEIVVVVLYQPEFPASVRAKDAWLDAARRAPPATVSGGQVFVIAVPHGDRLLDRLRSFETDVVVLTPLRSVDVRRIADQVRSAGMRTVTGTSAYGRGGIAAVSLLLRDGRPRIVIDERLSSIEGAHFSSQLLRVSEVVR